MTQPRALITGASAGLGKEFAKQLAARGKDLILVARRTQPMQALASALESEHGVATEVIQADLSEPATASQLYEAICERGLQVDYLINNAGSNGPDLLHDRDWPAHQKYLELMMTSITGLCHYFIPPMRERGFGRVLNVASVAGQITVSGDYSYGPTKAYVIALSKALSTTLRRDGVHVLALCPGFTHTQFHASERLTKMKNSTPAFIWYDASLVVAEGLAALEKGRSVYTTGRIYRLLIPILRMPLSRWLMSRIGVRRDW